MNRILNSIITAAGAVALFAVVAPSDAAAQQCRSSYGYGYGTGYYAPSYSKTTRYVAPVRRTYSSKSTRYRAKSRATQKRYARTPRKAIRTNRSSVRRARR